MAGRGEGAGLTGIPESTVVLPVERATIVQEYADGDMAVRIRVASEDVESFWQAFPDLNEPAFLANGHGAIECERGPIMKEYVDGALAFKLVIHPKDKAEFRRLWPKPGMAAVLAREAPGVGGDLMRAAVADEPPKYGPHARALRTHINFMGATKVWQAVGADEDYLEWLRTLPCAHCKWVPHWEMDTYVPCHAAHVRRVASGSGTSIKPKYSAIPLCPHGHGKSCHAVQHQEGESFLGGKEKVDKLRLHYVHQWVWATLKAKLGYEHWNQVPPETLIAWASKHGLLDTLPKIYLQDQ